MTLHLARNLYQAMRLSLSLYLTLVLVPSAYCASRLDFSSKDFDDNPSVFLNGPYDFFWDKPPVDAPIPGLPDLSLEAGIPWNRYKLSDGRVLPGQGRGTYQLRISGLTPRVDGYQIRMPSSDQAMRMLWIDEASGQVLVDRNAGSSRDKEPTGTRKNIFVSVYPDAGKTYVLIIEISNRHYHDLGGAWYPPELGIGGSLEQKLAVEGFFNILAAGVCLVSGLSTLMIWLRRRNDYASLGLATIAFVATCRVISTDRWCQNLTPDSFHDLLYRIEYGSMALGYMFIHYITWTFPQVRLFRWIIPMLSVWCATLTIVTLLAPVSTFTGILLLYQIGLLFGVFPVLYTIGQAIRMKLDGAMISAFGTLVVVATMIFDIIFVNRLRLSETFTVPFGISLYMFLQYQIIARRSAQAYRLAERLARENASVQTSLRIETETRFALAGAVAHQLNNPLNYIQMSLIDLKGRVDGLHTEVKTLLAGDDNDPELALCRETFEQIFQDLQRPFTCASQGIDRASHSLEEIRTLSGVDGMSWDLIELGPMMDEVKFRLAERLEPQEFRRVIFQIEDPGAKILGNYFFTKNAIETYISRSLALAETELSVTIRGSEGEHSAWAFQVTGSLSNDEVEWQALEERLTYMMKSARSKIRLQAQAGGYSLTIEGVPIEAAEKVEDEQAQDDREAA